MALVHLMNSLRSEQREAQIAVFGELCLNDEKTEIAARKR